MTTVLKSRYHLIAARLHDYAPEWRKMIVWLVVILLAFNAACAAVQNGGAPSYANPLPGEVIALRMSTVLRELRWSVMGSAKNIIMINPANNNLLFGFPYLNGWGWVCINGASSSICNALREIGSRGNLATSADFKTLMDCAEGIGCRPITGADVVKLFPALAKSIMDATTAFSNSVMPTLFVVPAGVVGEDPWATSQQ